MIPSITDEDRRTVKTNYEAWCEVLERRDQLNEEIKSLIGDTSSLLEVKKPIISKLFKTLKKREEDGGEEGDSIDEIIELVWK